MSTYETDTIEFAFHMGQEGLKYFDEVQTIVRCANTIQRIAVKACNVQLTSADERKDKKAADTILAIVGDYGIRVNFNGDPRGNCTKLILKSGKHNTWGGRESGFAVPTKRY